MNICPMGWHLFAHEDGPEAYCEEHALHVLTHPGPDAVDMDPLMCPHCRTEMTPSPTTLDRWSCHTCPRYALAGDGPEAIEQHEADRLRAIALVDAALGPRAVERESDRLILAEMAPTMGQSIQTTGCPKCGGTMYKTVDTDEHGNPTNESQWICNGCGHMM